MEVNLNHVNLMEPFGDYLGISPQELNQHKNKRSHRFIKRVICPIVFKLTWCWITRIDEPDDIFTIYCQQDTYHSQDNSVHLLLVYGYTVDLVVQQEYEQRPRAVNRVYYGLG